MIKSANFGLFGFIFFLLTNIKVCAGNNRGFIENAGQISDQFGNFNKDVRFVFCGNNGIRVHLRENGYSYEYLKIPLLAAPSGKSRVKHFPDEFTVSGARIDVDFQNCSGQIEISAADPLEGYLNYFTGGGAHKVKQYKSVLYRAVYPGIDIEFLVQDDPFSPFKYNIHLGAGAQLSDIRMLVKGAVPFLKNGECILNNEIFEVRENIPVSFYSDNHESLNVEFNLNGTELGFKGEPVKGRPLIIDPVSTLKWATYFGDVGFDIGTAVGVDGADNVFMCGYTTSNSNIASTGAYQFTYGGGIDIFLAKFTPSGQRLWSTYMGGSAADVAYAMAVLPDGSAYLTGGTTSTNNLASAGAHQTVYGGGINDVFVARFDQNGQRLWSTYYGGSEHDVAEAIAVDKFNNVYVSGHTESPNNMATPGAYKSVYNFNYDVCIGKFSPTGTMLWGTYYGDSGVDEAYAMATDTTGHVYITGGTASISDISTQGTHQLFLDGPLDAFVAKIDSGGKTLMWGTYFGGNSGEAGTAMKVAPNGIVYVGGITNSSVNIASAGAEQTVMGSFDDSFLAAFSSSGNVIWSTYFGGDDVDYIDDLVLDIKNDILISGATSSTAGISMNSPWQPSLATAGYYDAFFAKYNKLGQRVLATYFGGEANERAWGIALDNSGRVYLAGESTSTAGIATSGAHMQTHGGSADAMLAKFCIPFTPRLFPASTFTACRGTITVSTSPGYSSYQWSNNVLANPMMLGIFAPGTYTYFVNVNDGIDCAGKSDTLRLTVSACLGINESDLHPIRVFPIPAVDWLNIEHVEFVLPAIYTISDLAGREIRKGNLEPGAPLDIRGLATGTYILLAEDKTKVYRTKFVKD